MNTVSEVFILVAVLVGTFHLFRAWLLAMALLWITRGGHTIASPEHALVLLVKHGWVKAPSRWAASVETVA